MTLTSQNAGRLLQPPASILPVPGRTATGGRFADRYFLWLSLVLMGYALGGRGFAYWGFNPIFVGEITLLVGLVALLKSGLLGRLLSANAFLPLLLFMFWGAVCTVPYLEKYQKDAIRDAVLWGYGTFAFIVASLLIADPTKLQRLVTYFRRFAYCFLILAPVTSTVTFMFEPYLPTFPGGHVPIIQVKGGDMCVHLAGAFAFIVALGGGMNLWITSLLVPLNLGLNLHGRGAMLSFCAAAVMTVILRPFHPRAMRIFFFLGLGLFFLWASDFRLQRGAREISFRGLVQALSSITSESDDPHYYGSKQWRQQWWSDIIRYTFRGKYFWTGKGYGINLANDDGYQVEANEALRSPHNGHLTILARSGVPGFGLWIAVQLSWMIMIIKAYHRAWRKGHRNWSGMFMFLGAYWAAFMVNATFDVFLEGPMGGIWFWCVYGAGVAATQLYRRYPDLLTPAEKPVPALGQVRS